MDKIDKKLLAEKTDEELILEFQKTNSIEIYNELVKRYKDPLMNFIFKFVGSRDLAEDILQETFFDFIEIKIITQRLQNFLHGFIR